MMRDIESPKQKLQSVKFYKVMTYLNEKHAETANCERFSRAQQSLNGFTARGCVMMSQSRGQAIPPFLFGHSCFATFA